MISDIIKNGINGVPNIPGDKSISHRSIIIPSISNGICEVNNILKSDDVLHTLNAFKTMGVNIEEHKEKIIIRVSIKSPRLIIIIKICSHNYYYLQ